MDISSDFSQVQSEPEEDEVAGDALRILQLLDRALEAVDVDPLSLKVYESPQPYPIFQVLLRLEASEKRDAAYQR